MPTLLITGANRGLGFEFVRQYAADGWDIVACCRAPDKADALKKIAGIRIETLDIADGPSRDALAAKVKGAIIDLLINNAGIYSGANGGLGNDQSQSLGTIDAQAWAQVLTVNAIAPVMLIQSLIPYLKKTKIINISSRMGSIAQMGGDSIAYRTSKAALNAAMRVVSHHLPPECTIYNFHPGWVQTDMGGGNADMAPAQSVGAMRKTIAALKSAQSGSFLNYDGQIIAW